ncbi:metal-dependent transcriptional regulator [Sediminispirochaeta bajacaliforniensis]|uniref:metal-dependent transcriptional regulator n=1 Tax=Sediminispirochaeta bajacaliforniensis TaxID=148 RepID=UPI0003611857|nr:metal-dependent transcriptional regulator [Sediminispirochaeta bajacaliforniensis]
MGENLSKTVEDYLKIILEESGDNSSEIVHLGLLAQRMKVTPGTVTTMIKRIATEGLVEYIPRKGCRLTEKGTYQALTLLRKHRLVEALLVTVLKMDWSDVHEEAESLEHELSDKVVEYIDRLLGYPEKDPHGQPIFRDVESYRAYSTESLLRLDQAKPGNRYCIIKVEERKEHREFLKYLEQNGMRPGELIDVIGRSEGGGWLEIETAKGKVLKLGTQKGTSLYVSEA